MFDFVNKLKDKGRWRIFKLKLIDARLYFVSIFVGLLTGLVAVPYHYLLQFFFNLRHVFRMFNGRIDTFDLKCGDRKEFSENGNYGGQ